MIDFGKTPDKMSELELRREVKEWRRIQSQSSVEQDHFGPYGPVCMNTGQFDAGECWLCAGKRKQTERDLWKQKAAEMQLIAGRYQYLFEQAMKTVNKIDDFFEYSFFDVVLADTQKRVQKYLKEFTDVAAKVHKSPTETKD
jgi:hypothetical protein